MPRIYKMLKFVVDTSEIIFFSSEAVVKNKLVNSSLHLLLPFYYKIHIVREKRRAELGSYCQILANVKS